MGLVLNVAQLTRLELGREMSACQNHLMLVQEPDPLPRRCRDDVRVGIARSQLRVHQAHEVGEFVDALSGVGWHEHHIVVGAEGGRAAIPERIARNVQKKDEKKRE